MSDQTWPIIWDDQMIIDFFNDHPNHSNIIHTICALSGRSKADVKRVLMGEK